MTNAVGRPIAPLVLSSDERAYLERQVRRRRVARALSERCRVILRCADGVPSKSVASELGVPEHTVGKWRRRFLKDRIEGLLDEARPGRPRTIEDDQVAAVIERTLRSTPNDATHWSIRSMAVATGFSHTTIRRIWTAFGLQPHRSQTFKLSSDPLFVDKVRARDNYSTGNPLDSRRAHEGHLGRCSLKGRPATLLTPSSLLLAITPDVSSPG